MREYLNPLVDLLNYQLFNLGEAQITPLSLIYLLLLSIVLIYVTAKLRDLLVAKLLYRTSLSHGSRQAIATVARYVLLFVGFILILQTVGIDLTAFNVLAGAIGIGIGLGLQGIANNFISGLILLLERPVQVGDRIEIEKVTGKVVSIGARATRILTNDNIAIIVPNSKLVSENVINWSYENEMVRFKIPIMVVHESDIHLVKKLMMEAATENSDVVEDPPPAVRFMKMNEEGLYFELRVWSREQFHKPAALRSDLTFAIVDKLRKHRIKLSRNQAEPGEWAAGAPNDLDDEDATESLNN